VIQDDSEVTDWALVLRTSTERRDWTLGMGLRFRERFYKLQETAPPTPETSGWTYRFGFWPDGEILRRLVDYEEDCAQRATERERSLGSKLQSWLSGKKSHE
jgi:hypothetical protein